MTVIQRDTAGLTGDQLDAAVAHVLGVPTFHPPRTMSERHTIGFRGQPFRPSSDWADGGPIIEREKIAAPGSPATGSALMRGSAGRNSPGVTSLRSIWTTRSAAPRRSSPRCARS